MEAQFGWTQISRAAVQRAEAQLSSESQGVVDELGLLEIHQGYADRFFPGTSVLHTRLRYILFVAWAYEDMLHHRKPPRDIGRAVAEVELRLGKALYHTTDAWGLIGRRTLPKMPAQRPSSMYWSALGAWGLLHKRLDGTLPSRAEVHALLAGRGKHIELRDDENRPLESHASPFIALPPRPEGWPGGHGIDFTLSKAEQDFLRELLSRVHEPEAARLSLFSRLAKAKAGKRLTDDTPFICDEVKAVAGDDWPVIRRADQAASLAAVVRALYDAMVETLAEQDGLGDRRVARRVLEDAIKEHGDNAAKLELDALCKDIDASPVSPLMRLLVETQEWLEGVLSGDTGVDDWQPLLKRYKEQEVRRKGLRARLALNAKGRRREWWVEVNHNTGGEALRPLHYRWHIARNLLRDLENRS